MKTSQSAYRRALSAVSLFTCLITLAVGCSDDESGTDIIVGDGGDGGKSSGGGGKASGGKNTGGKSSSGSSMGGAPDGEAGESMGGESGSGGSGGTGGGGAGGGGAGGGGAGGGGAGGGGAGGGGTGGGGAGGGGTGGGGTGGGGTGGGGTGGGGGGTGGGGTVVECDTPTAECEDPSTPLCSSTCELVSTQECLDCENAGDCFEFVENCSEAIFPDEADRELCYEVMQCVQLSNCYDGTNPLGFCFCGDVPAATCGAAPLSGPGSPNGDCADLIVEGLMPVTTSAQVLGLLTATSKPTGGALARLQCEKVAGASACLGVCGFDSDEPFPPLPE